MLQFTISLSTCFIVEEKESENDEENTFRKKKTMIKEVFRFDTRFEK